MINFYTIFHGNLAFSAIEEDSLPEVIDNCYFPLLDFIEKTEIPTGLELSAYSLEKIHHYRPEWIEQFKDLHQQNLIELVGSGYMQIIGPLVPYQVNIQNQQIGLQVYNDILGFQPTLAYVNEQAFSQSLVDIYNEVGYQGIAMEWNNAYANHCDWNVNNAYLPSQCKGIETTLPLLWTDSIIFQKFQRHVHGEITLDEYLSKIRRYIAKGCKALPIYTSDLEVFNYRPGRFETEATIEYDEWEKINNCLRSLHQQHSFMLPSDILKKHRSNANPLTLTCAETPILVKKQGKYSLSRWAACGRGATTINHLCYQHLQTIKSSKDIQKWKELLTYWGSDFRTHITPTKWQQAMLFFSQNLSLPSEKKEEDKFSNTFKIFQTRQRLTINNDMISCHFLLNKGLCLDSITYQNHPSAVGTVYHGDYDYIHHGADYYTGTTVIDSAEFGRVTDLSAAQQLSINEINGKLIVSATIALKGIGYIKKKWLVGSENACLTYSANIILNSYIKGSIRTGTVTLKPQPNHQKLWYQCKNGGSKYERFDIDNETTIQQHQAQSLLQSSQGGLGVTNGKLSIGYNEITLCDIHIHHQDAYPFVMLENSIDNDLFLTRVYFSLQELDETLKVHEQREFSLSYSINLK